MSLASSYDVPTRHWHPGSETISGGDSLLSALARGWKVTTIGKQFVQTSGGSSITCYNITLERNQSCVVMSLVSNPVIDDIVKNLRVK